MSQEKVNDRVAEHARRWYNRGLDAYRESARREPPAGANDFEQQHWLAGYDKGAELSWK